MQIVALDVERPEMAIDFSSKEVEPMLDEGVVHGQPTYCLGTVKTVQVDGWTEIVHVCYFHNIASK